MFQPIKELVAASKKGGKRKEKDEALEENLEEASERGDIHTENAYANRLLEMRSRLRKKDLDTTLGIRQLDGKGFMFGDQPIRLDRDHVFVGDTPDRVTPGLLELLLKLEPNAQLVTTADAEQYRTIVKQTHADHVRFKPEKPLRLNRSKKIFAIYCSR